MTQVVPHAPADSPAADPLALTARAEAGHFWFRGFRHFVTPVLDEIAAGRTGLRIVDCGCGTGHNLALLNRYGHVVGFDRASALSASPRHAPFLRADVTRAPFPSNAFDIATSFDVLQCLEEDDAAIAEMARLVKPGGAIVLTMAALEILRGDHSESWHEFRRYTPAMARRLVARAGLHAERVAFLFASLVPALAVRRGTQRLLRPYRGPRPAADIAIPAAPINAVLTWVLRAEAAAARHLPMPCGSSLLVVARKP